MSGWNKKETVLAFIELYQSFPALWKVKSKEYCNKLKRELAFSQLVKFCRTFELSADKNFVLNKINNLRSAFRKELKKAETSKLSGAGREDVYEPRLWYYSHMMFIQDQELPRRGTSNLDIDHVDEYHFTETEVPTSPPASPEMSLELDVLEIPTNKDCCSSEMLSQNSVFPSASSQGRFFPRTSSHSIFPGAGPSHSVGLSPDQLRCQGSSPCPSQPQGAFWGPSQSQNTLVGPPYSQDPFPATSQSSTQETSPSQAVAYPYAALQVHGPSKPAPKTTASKRPNKRKSEDEEILKNARARLLNPPPTPQIDENESFGKTIGLLLGNASPEQRIFARKLMYEVMTEAELGTLSRDSYFVATPAYRGMRRETENITDYTNYYNQSQ